MTGWQYQHSGFSVWQLPALRDNYIYLLFPEATRTAWAIDPAVAPVVRRHCKAHQRQLAHIWNTHHHWDHTDGNLSLLQDGSCEVHASAVDAWRTPGISHPVVDGESHTLDGLRVEVLHVPGHTDGHVAYCMGDALFCGDVLFSAGCGRIFEGTHEQMLDSLARLCTLGAHMNVYCAHEYTAVNLAFARKVADSLDDEPFQQACQQRWQEVRRLRAEHLPTVPSTLAEEKRSNPFLQVWRAEFRQAYARAHSCAADALSVFTHLRKWRNHA